MASAEGCGICPHHTRCRLDKRARVMFRVLHPDMQQVLRELSSASVIYIGREGIGLTRLFSKEVLRIGTIKAIDQHCTSLTEEERRLIELTAIEGPRWICYQRVIDALWNVQKYAPGEKPVKTEAEAMSTEIWPVQQGR